MHRQKIRPLSEKTGRQLKSKEIGRLPDLFICARMFQLEEFEYVLVKPLKAEVIGRNPLQRHRDADNNPQQDEAHEDQ